MDGNRSAFIFTLLIAMTLSKACVMNKVNTETGIITLQTVLESSCEISMELLGQSGWIQNSPALYPDLSGFDTALDQIRSVEVYF